MNPFLLVSVPQIFLLALAFHLCLCILLIFERTSLCQNWQPCSVFTLLLPWSAYTTLLLLPFVVLYFFNYTVSRIMVFFLQKLFLRAMVICDTHNYSNWLCILPSFNKNSISILLKEICIREGICASEQPWKLTVEELIVKWLELCLERPKSGVLDLPSLDKELAFWPHIRNPQLQWGIWDFSLRYFFVEILTINWVGQGFSLYLALFWVLVFKLQKALVLS